MIEFYNEFKFSNSIMIFYSIYFKRDEYSINIFPMTLFPAIVLDGSTGIRLDGFETPQKVDSVLLKLICL